MNLAEQVCCRIQPLVFWCDFRGFYRGGKQQGQRQYGDRIAHPRSGDLLDPGDKQQKWQQTKKPGWKIFAGTNMSYIEWLWIFVLSKKKWIGPLNDQWGREKTESVCEESESPRQQTDKQTEWEVSGLISNACCPALALHPSCKRKTVREKEPWQMKVFFCPSIIHRWIRARMNGVEEERGGWGEGLFRESIKWFSWY